MTVRFDDADRILSLSVRDLVEAGPPSGHLVLEVATTRQARMAAGRAVHEAWQDERAADDDAFRAEVALAHTLEVDGWTVRLQGRVDGLTEEGGHTVVEEVKATALDSDRLAPTRAADWPAWTAQLEVYLWMLAVGGRADPLGRLVLVSLLDGSRHILPVPLDTDRVATFVQTRMARLIRLRTRRLAWYATRRRWAVPPPFGTWRAGQEAIASAVRTALADGAPLLVEAPTGMGKTAAVLHGALAYALRHDKQVFWATSRNTQQAGVLATLVRFRDAGVPLRWVGLRAKDKACLNDVVACRPDTCPFARDYYDKVERGRLVEQALESGTLDPDTTRALAETHEVCPFQLAMDATEHVDVVVGDVNYAASPHGRLGRIFGETTASDWVVILDEAHQLVDRARDHLSPSIEAALARRALDTLDPVADAAFAEVARDVLATVEDVVAASPVPERGDTALAELGMGPWRRLAEQVNTLALDDALRRAGQPPGDDAYLELSRRVLRFADAIGQAGAETVALARHARGDEAVRLLCLDPSPALAPLWTSVAGVVGCSATLTPHAFYRDLLGLGEATRRLDVPSPFPAAHRSVLVAPRVSTRFRDRAAQAPATARLLSQAILATPGNVAVYFPSFAMLEDLVPRLEVDGREVLAQPRHLTEDERTDWVARLRPDGDPVVLAAVLGGIFAEGVDLPPGALDTIAVVGPALPPVGLERDLLRAYYDDRFGQGFRYASLVPGMTRVVQAAGRLHRRPEDRGVILLVGRRYRWRDHAALLPATWAVQVPDDPAAAIRAFWTAR